MTHSLSVTVAVVALVYDIAPSIHLPTILVLSGKYTSASGGYATGILPLSAMRFAAANLVAIL